MRLSHIKPNQVGHFTLTAAESRTHYGQFGEISGGQPYFTLYMHVPKKKYLDDAFAVESRGTIIGLVQKWSDGMWTFSRVTDRLPKPFWLKSCDAGTIYLTSSSLKGSSESLLSCLESI